MVSLELSWARIMTWLPSLPIFALVLSAVLSAWALRHARRRGVLDRPGERSLHEEPTPRGGGIGILAALLVAAVTLWWGGWLSGPRLAGLAPALLAVGLTGWYEDHRELDWRIRISIHAVAAAWLVAVAGGVTSMDLGSWSVPLGALGYAVAFMGILWLTNLYNFMDGIDALASAEGIFAGAVMGAWLALAGEPGLALLALCVAGACAGFLPWNLPRARLFLGDVGSTSLGFLFGAVAVLGAGSGALPAALSMLVLGVFVFDATFTLLARLARGERWYTAHREHAYQYLVRAGMGHGRVVLVLSAVNLLVILPVVVLIQFIPAALGVAAGFGALAGWAAWFQCRRRCALVEQRTGRT